MIKKFLKNEVLLIDVCGAAKTYKYVIETLNEDENVEMKLGTTAMEHNSEA